MMFGVGVKIVKLNKDNTTTRQHIWKYVVFEEHFELFLKSFDWKDDC